jgi:hypothetical protein
MKSSQGRGRGGGRRGRKRGKAKAIATKNEDELAINPALKDIPATQYTNAINLDSPKLYYRTPNREQSLQQRDSSVLFESIKPRTPTPLVLPIARNLGAYTPQSSQSPGPRGS